MAESRAPQSISSFLRSYSPDIFEWECSHYKPLRGFLWSKPSLSVQSGNFASDSIDTDELFCDGQNSALSPGSDSLTDMSISDTSSGRYLAMPPRMNRTRNGYISALDPSSDSRTFSDMSAASDFSDAPEDFERFMRNLPTQSHHELLRHAAVPARLSRLPLDPGGCDLIKIEDDGPDAEAVCRILEWTTSLFESVACSALSYSVQPGNDKSLEPTSSKFQDSLSALEAEESCFTPCTKDFDPDILSRPSSPTVRLRAFGPRVSQGPILANPMSIIMPGSIDYEAINPEQPTTAKQVCMWGRRLERIPKVHLAGQKEAIYCFDSRKQRQKQKIGTVASTRQTAGDAHSDQATRIFYRARPISSPFIRRGMPSVPVDAVKIMQGQVLLQNVAPVRFSSALSLPHTSDRQEFFQRLPLTPRTNNAGQDTYTPTVRRMKRMTTSGFL